MPDNATPSAPVRRRGRPVPGAAQDVRPALMAAAAVVYARHGYHGTTVEMILQQAGISRPTFYRCFSDKHDIIAAVVTQANDALRQRIREVIAQGQDPVTKVESAVDAYLAWGQEQGPLAGPLYAEHGDPQSPAGGERQKVLIELAQLFIVQAEAEGRASVDPLLYDALLRIVEYLGSSVFVRPDFTAADVARARAVILRIVLASLAQDGEEAPPLPALG